MPLGLAEVGDAEHPDFAVRVGELRGPLHGVVPILELLDEWGELTLRGVAASHVLDYHDVAVLGCFYGVEVGARKGDVLTVRRAGQEDRVGSVGGGTVDVRHKRRAVPHLGGHVLLDADLHEARSASRTG